MDEISLLSKGLNFILAPKNGHPANNGASQSKHHRDLADIQTRKAEILAELEVSSSKPSLEHIPSLNETKQRKPSRGTP